MDRNAARIQIKLLWATPTSQARCSMELRIYAGWTTSDPGQALQIPHAVDCASGNWAIQTLFKIPICTGKSILHGYWHLSKHLSSIQTEYEGLFYLVQVFGSTHAELGSHFKMTLPSSNQSTLAVGWSWERDPAAMPQMTQISALAAPKRDRATSNVKVYLGADLKFKLFCIIFLKWYWNRIYWNWNHDYQWKKWILQTRLDQKTIPMA